MKRHYLLAIVVTLVAVEGCSEKQQSANGPRQVQWKKSDPAVAPTTATEREKAILPKTHFAAGCLHEQNGAYYKAAEQYRKAVIVDPEYVAAWNRLGVVSGKLGRLAQAENALEKAVSLQPDSALLHNNLGFAYTLGQKWDRAENELNTALKMKSDFSRARINLAMVLAKQDRFEEALESFVSVLPEQDALYNLGLMFRSKNRYRDAAEAFTQALEIDPHFVAAERQLEALAPRLEMSGDVEAVLDDAAWAGLARVLWGPMPEPWLADERKEALAFADEKVDLPEPADTENAEQDVVNWDLVVEALTGIVEESDPALEPSQELENAEPEAMAMREAADVEPGEEEVVAIPSNDDLTENKEANEPVGKAETAAPAPQQVMVNDAHFEPIEPAAMEVESKQPADVVAEEPDDNRDASNAEADPVSVEPLSLPAIEADAPEVAADVVLDDASLELVDQIKPKATDEAIDAVEVGAGENDILADVIDLPVAVKEAPKAPMATEPFGELVLAWLDSKPLVTIAYEEQLTGHVNNGVASQGESQRAAKKMVKVQRKYAGDEMTYESLTGFWPMVWSQYESDKQSMEAQEFLATEIDECEIVRLASSDWLAKLDESQEIITLRDLPVFVRPTHFKLEQPAAEMVADVEAGDDSPGVEIVTDVVVDTAKEEIMAAMELQYPSLLIMPDDAESDGAMLFGAAVYNPFAD